MNAAGPPGKDGSTLREVAKNGAGGLVAKTISTVPASVPRPCMTMLDRGNCQSHILMVMNKRFVRVTKSSLKVPKGLLNVELWSDIPYQQWLKKEYKLALETGLPVIASIGYTPEQVKELAPQIEKAGIHAIEFSTHYLGVDPKPIIDVTETLKDVVDIPIFVKLSPHTIDISVFAKAAEKAGVDGIVAINSFGPCLHIDITTGRPYLGGKDGYGWISGPALKPLAIRCVSEVARTVKVPVIGVGGIMTGADAIEHIMAGATAVQICTGAIIEGPTIFRRLTKEIEDFMKNYGYDSIEDMRGIALKHLPKQVVRTHSIPPKVDLRICSGCGLCERSCVYSAIKLKEEAMKVVAIINEERCYGCGLCVSICPEHALSFED
jgi:dihydroorotate dehydrogenase subfamily 1